MKIVIVPDSFKGSMPSLEVARVIAEAAKEVFPKANIVQIPIADGGEGTVDALCYALQAEKRYVSVMGPLGQQIEAYYGDLGKTAVIEMAAASGLPLLKEDARNPMETTTFGTGEMIKTAMDAGFKKIIIGIGGSATNDGGVGAVQALGARFFSADGEITQPMSGGKLLDITSIDVSDLDPRLIETEITVMCDVTNPLTGPNGATFVYGPQKGADNMMLTQLESGMRTYESLLNQMFGGDKVDIPGAGAAGGLGAALHCFCGGNLVRGIDAILDLVDFDLEIEDADLIVTGEGRLDVQSAQGKAVYGVATRAKEKNIPVVVIAGSIGDGAEKVYSYGVSAFFAIVNASTTLSEAMKNTEPLLYENTLNIFKLLKAYHK